MQLSEGMELPTGETVIKVKLGVISEVGILKDEFAGLKVVKRLRDDILRQAGSRQDLQAAFFHECRLAASRLKNAPYTATTEGVMRLDGLGPVLFMAFVDGPRLTDLLHTGPQSASQTIRVGGQIAAALSFAHRRGIRHRDLKPNNILLNRENEVRLIDWGLAGVSHATGLTVGVIDYFSPQRRYDNALDDPADDVYALGVNLFQCLAGRFPSESPTPREIRQTLTAAQPLIPDELLTLVTDMLAADPADRPTADELVGILRDPLLHEDARHREIEQPFCPQCGFITMRRLTTCPVCARQMRQRIPQSPPPGMVRIRAGSYAHGLTEEQARQALNAAFTGQLRLAPQDIESLTRDNEPRRVFCPAFDIDEMPVTNQAYAAFVSETNYPAPDGLDVAKPALPDHPVTNVSWKDALCYALWAGKRLPTPTEWEKAARGMTDDRTYPWGYVWRDDLCNHNRTLGADKTTPVDRYTRPGADGRSPFGVADMAGNVREWTSEGRSPYTRGLRGGGWASPVAIEGIVAVQVDAEVDYQDPQTGFRCAKSIAYTDEPVEPDTPPGRNGEQPS